MNFPPVMRICFAVGIVLLKRSGDATLSSRNLHFKELQPIIFQINSRPLRQLDQKKQRGQTSRMKKGPAKMRPRGATGDRPLWGTSGCARKVFHWQGIAVSSAYVLCKR